MNFKDIPPERMAEMRRKGQETQRRNNAARRSRATAPPGGARRTGKTPASAGGKTLAEPVPDQSLPNAYAAPQVLAEPVPPKPPRPRPPASDPDTAYQVWLAALTDETRELFSEAELKADFAELWAKAQEEQRTRRRKGARDLALSTARQHLGLLPEATVERLQTARLNATPVTMIVELPPAMDNGDPPDLGLRVNGRLIEHGKRWHGTYGEGASLREMLYRLGQHELIFKGQNTKYRAWMMARAFAQLGGSLEVEGTR